MKIVIDIPEEDYQKLKAKDRFYDMYLNYYEKLIVNGTPLPKGHGKLIDADALESRMKIGYCIVKNAQTIVEADAKSEGRNDE